MHGELEKSLVFSWTRIENSQYDHNAVSVVNLILMMLFCCLDRLCLPNHYYISAITDDVTMEYLIPTKSGAGVCTTSLVDYLIYTHNNFIERCHSVLAEKNQKQRSDSSSS